MGIDSYVDWEEVVDPGDKGREEVHYYLNRGGGGRDLAVVRKEKNGKRLSSFRYTIKKKRLLPSVLNRSPWQKLRSRGEVIDWLDSILSDEQPDNSLRRCGGLMNNKFDDDSVKDFLTQKVDRVGTEFSWLGSYWTCRKNRRHYKSFCRNGAVISVQDFVFVLAEENKRLVAYLDDMYEDVRGNNMVVVRWFHKIDEVDFVLSPANNTYNDREIFFSLCLQDLSIECIDGLATVLSPEHYRNFVDDNASACADLAPFVCYRQFDNDEVRPFDVTHMKGYWNQKILLRNNTSSLGDAIVFNRPSKRVRWSKECDLHLKSPEKGEINQASLQASAGSYVDDEGDVKAVHLVESVKDRATKKVEDALKGRATKKAEVLTIGSEIEVLSQDSGIRGCWFRALIIKKHKDKVKIQYKDLEDAIDESKKLEEWILSSRVAAPDALGIRLSGRSIVRPTPSNEKGLISSLVNVGSVVDARWHDGWWEGIVVKKESEDCLFVYLPDEKHEVKFTTTDLRRSMEWFENGWQHIKERPDLASKFSPTNKIKSDTIIHEDTKAPIHTTPQKIKIKVKLTKKEPQPVRDLSKVPHPFQLQWKPSGKKRRRRSAVSKLHSPGGTETSCQTWEKLFVNSSNINVDSDSCKHSSNSPLGSSPVSSLRNLVISE